MAWRLAGSPTRRSPMSVKATTLGVRRLPSWLAMTLTSLPSITATTEFVVPGRVVRLKGRGQGLVQNEADSGGRACGGKFVTCRSPPASCNLAATTAPPTFEPGLLSQARQKRAVAAPDQLVTNRRERYDSLVIHRFPPKENTMAT